MYSMHKDYIDLTIPRQISAHDRTRLYFIERIIQYESIPITGSLVEVTC